MMILVLLGWRIQRLSSALTSSPASFWTQGEYLYSNEFGCYKSLSSRSSVIFGVFLGIGTFIFALIRAYAPKLTLMAVFGTIALDIFCVSVVRLFLDRLLNAPL
jgi:hypothetical protein